MNTQFEINFDSLLPAEMAQKAEQVGMAKANMGPRRTLMLGVLAGAFIALGAVFSTTVATGSGVLGFGLGRLLAGLVFCLGLILVVVAGAELFTGNNLIVMAWASGKVTTRQVVRNWLLVYVSNFAGALGTAVLVFIAGQYQFAGGQVGLTALNIAAAKVGLGFWQAVALGILCNTLVCLAVWLTFSARTTTDRILAVLFPISGFVAAGFEHSVANMYFIPIGLMIRWWAPEGFWSAIEMSAAAYAGLDWPSFLIGNLLPVTIGNVIGGAVLVGAVYWGLYLRKVRVAVR